MKFLSLIMFLFTTTICLKTTMAIEFYSGSVCPAPPQDEDHILPERIPDDLKGSALVIEWTRTDPEYYRVREFAPNYFTTHGLRPDISRSKCNVVPFDEPGMEAWLVGDKLDSMIKYWPSVWAGPLKDDKSKLNKHIEFWRYQWEEHGTCSGMYQNDYFDITIKMVKIYIPLIMFAMGSPTIDPPARINLEAVRQNLLNSLGKKVQFKCLPPVTEGVGDVDHLYRIVFNVTDVSNVDGSGWEINDNSNCSTCNMKTELADVWLP